MLYNFEWDFETEKQNDQKYDIVISWATDVFRDPNHITVFDEENSTDEDHWITLGSVKYGSLLIVIHTFEQATDYAHIRLISARKATQTEIKQYEEYNQ